MEFKDTSVDMLKLNVGTGEVPDDSLDKIVVESGDFTDIFGNSFRAEVAIIGASHAITVADGKTGKVLFKEVLANVDLRDVATSDSGLVLYDNEEITAGKDIKREVSSTGIKYSFSSNVLTMKELQNFRGFVSDTLLHKSLQYEGEDLQGGKPMVLKFVFPCDVETPVEAQTLVKFSCVADRMLITSYHVYPNNDAAFVSYSEIVTTKKIPQVEGLGIVSKELFVKNMAAVGIDVETAIDILEKSSPQEIFDEEVFAEFKEDLGNMFEVFTQAAETAKEKLEKIDKDEVIDNVKAGIGKFLDSFKTNKE